jgi:hypothetical protein
MAKQRSVSLDDAKTNTRTDKVKVTDLIHLVKLPEKKWVTGRLYGGLNSYATGWVSYKKKEGGGKGKFPVNLRSYDPQTGQFDSTIYDPWFALWQKEKDEGVAKEKMTVQINKKFYGDFLSRSAQRQAPSTITKPTRAERESGFKDKDSDTWTPWSVFAMPPSFVEKVKELKGLNLVKSSKSGTKAYSVADEKYGCDVRIYYDSEKSPADQYQVQLGERTPLTEEELALLRYDHSQLVTEQTDEEVKRDFESFCRRAGIELDEEPKKKRKKAVEDDDDDEAPKSKKRRASEDDDEEEPPKKSKRRASVDDEDDEDDEPAPKSKKRRPDPDEDDDDLDDDDEPAPKKKGKKVEEDEDDYQDDDDDDEPRKRKTGTTSKASASTKRSSKRAAEDDEDDESDDLGDEDDDEEDVKKSSKKRRPDPDEDDDDLDDEPAPKKKKRVVEDDDDDEPAPKSKKRRPDPDEDDDLDDEPQPKRKKKVVDDEDDEPAPKRKKKPVVEDDDDDDL